MLKTQIVGSVASDNGIGKDVPRVKYEEKIEDGKIVLQGRSVKLVQIMDTPEDRELYYNVMNEYLKYVKKEYVQDANIDNVDLSTCFEAECVIRDKRKLPMFFAYRNDGKLLGTIGGKYLFVLKDGADVVWNEYSCRFVGVAKDGYSMGKSGVEALSIFPVFAHQRSVYLFFTSWQKQSLRDLWTHYAENYGFRFIGQVLTTHDVFLRGRQVKNDVFAISGLPSEWYQKVLSFVSL